MEFVFVLPAILASFGVLMVNSFSWEDFLGEGFSEINSRRSVLNPSLSNAGASRVCVLIVEPR
jgi:hypothetical protein